MKQRNIMAVIFLSIITCGIYDLFWLVKIKKELNAKTNVHTPTLWLLAAPYLLLTLGIIVSVAVSQGSPNGATIANIITLVVYLLAFVAVVPITFYWFFKFSKGVNHYTNGEMNTAMTFILLWLLRFIGIAVIQDKFNDMLHSGMQPINQTPGYPANPSAAPQYASQPPVLTDSGMPAQDPMPPTPPQDQTPPTTPPTNPIG